MTVWVDADSFPRECKELLERTAIKRSLVIVFVANKVLKHKPFLNQTEPGAYTVKVESGPGVADEYIMARAAIGDLVLTRDLPLAATLVERSITTINDRGTIFTSENLRERLSQRDFMAHLRDSGLASDGARTYGKKEYQAFAQSFDASIIKLVKKAN